jgi:hypothetical protein
VDFSEARDLFVNIFHILDQTKKFMDRGLIIKKPRGFSAKMPRITEFRLFRFILQWEKRGPGPLFVDHGLGPVHGGPARRHRREVTGEWPGWGSGLPVLTGGGREGKRWVRNLPWGSPELGERQSGGTTRVKWWRRWGSTGACSGVRENGREAVRGVELLRGGGALL